MTTAQRMRAYHSASGIYGEDTPVLDAELQAYAAEIERMYTSLDSMFKERFISTAEDLGLRIYEELFGPARTGEDTDKRRRLLQLRMNLGEGDFTPEGIRKALDSLGLEYTVSEFPPLYRLNITATADYTAAQQAFIRREIGKIIPAHLEFQLTFNTLTWLQLDALDRTFDTIDSENLTWEQIDSRTA